MYLYATLLLCFAAGANAFWSSGSSGGGGNSGGNYQYDITTTAGLRELYNAKVTRAERYERPLAGFPPSRIADALGAKHSGVVVTTENGQRWLVHKGDEYGNASATVVAKADYMSYLWTMTRSKNVYRSTVGDYVRVGGTTYSLWTDNCNHASARMMDTLW